MMYNLLVPGERVPERLDAVLSGAFGVLVADVDVSDESEVENRNWNATVTCEYEKMSGDVRWALTVYASEEVSPQPPEEALARALARELDVPVLFLGEGPLPPGVRQVATPEGQVTHARIGEPETDEEGVTVEAVEIPVAGFPKAAVHKLPEIIKELQLPTPVTDSHVAPEAGGPLSRVYDLLVNWERLTVRTEQGWPPSHWYPASMYAEDLAFRDELTERVAALSGTQRVSAQRALDEVDATYRGLTTDDGGRALAAAVPVPSAYSEGELPWYWRRRPVELPWGEDQAG
ncbi:hypothetical protein [Streptomyces sp. NPDC059455]|uniref:hypothetical protein n=1 Tax=Streptomyces sp. NPDC059455 TaxID=3346837 RepID=UPI0036875F2B